MVSNCQTSFMDGKYLGNLGRNNRPGREANLFFISANDKKGTRTLNKSVGKFAKCISPPTKEGRSALSFLRALPVNKD